jgi:hypothetical protein
MLNLSLLPTLRFWHDGAQEELVLAQAGRQIQWLSELFAERFSSQQRIGVILPTGPGLVLSWLALLQARKEPCLLQYPTEKISKDYWRDLVGHTVSQCRKCAGAPSTPDPSSGLVATRPNRGV